MKTVCKKDKCTGCMACVDICPKGAISIKDELKNYNAVIDESKCINCNICDKVCQKNNRTDITAPIKWYQGWVKDEGARNKSSSGGVAYAITKAFIENGGIVCSCIFRGGQFVFDFAIDVDEISKFAGSKYVKSNPSGIYVRIQNYLKEDKKILFIGLPCQVAALKKIISGEYQKKLYTADLICHGTPSPKLLDRFLCQYQYSLSSMADIEFREKAKMQICSDHKGIITKGVSDKYTIAFLSSLTYTDNCYECDYARLERVSDLTLGDSWGSELSVEEQKKGISLVLCQTEKGIEMIESADVELQDVDLQKAVSNNHQLKRPSNYPRGRVKFFKKIYVHKFNKLVFINLPKQCLRQDIKEFLIRIKVIQR